MANATQTRYLNSDEDELRNLIAEKRFSGHAITNDDKQRLARLWAEYRYKSGPAQDTYQKRLYDRIAAI